MSKKVHCSFINCMKPVDLSNAKIFPYNQQAVNMIDSCGLGVRCVDILGVKKLVFHDECYNKIVKRMENNPPWKLKFRMGGSFASNMK